MHICVSVCVYIYIYITCLCEIQHNREKNKASLKPTTQCKYALFPLTLP